MKIILLIFAAAPAFARISSFGQLRRQGFNKHHSVAAAPSRPTEPTAAMIRIIKQLLQERTTLHERYALRTRDGLPAWSSINEKPVQKLSPVWYY